MYEQATNEMYRKELTSELINDITIRNYNVTFTLV